jgi:hypothetical protein
MKATETITSVGQFFEAVFQHAEKSGDTWSFSDGQAATRGPASIVEVLASLVGARQFLKETKKLKQLAVHNLRLNKS